MLNAVCDSEPSLPQLVIWRSSAKPLMVARR